MLHFFQVAKFQVALFRIQGYFKGTETQLIKYWLIRLERPRFSAATNTACGISLRKLTGCDSGYINSLPLSKLLAQISAGVPGAESENELFKSKTTFLPNLI